MPGGGSKDIMKDTKSKLQLLTIKASDKAQAVQEVSDYFLGKGFKIAHEIDLLRPWGFYFYFDRDQTRKFADEFFVGVELTGIDISLPLQPKVLVFEPGKRLSWQYHHRRAEIWRCITEKCWVMTSPTDEQTSPQIIKFGEVINSTAGMRHRAGADEKWGAVAEIWQHTDPSNPSNEEDVVRLQDDYGRH